MPRQPRSQPVVLPPVCRFQGFPYLVTRVIPALYHIILMPTHLSDSERLTIARKQVLANRLDACLVFANDRAVYFDTDGRSSDTRTPPAGGVIVAGQLLPVVDFAESDELRARREGLDEFAAASRARGGAMMGDLTKGGRLATEEESRRLAGVEADGRPVGLERCPQCQAYRGRCLDPSENFRGQVMTVHCRCDNHNRCARCGDRSSCRRGGWLAGTSGEPA